MSGVLKIGLIGDHDPEVTAHRAIPEALGLAARGLGVSVAPEWVHTASLGRDFSKRLGGFDGLWCVPASPYADMDGALRAIGFARKNLVPFLGTCGGFQHVLIEYARSVLGLIDADHAESNPDARVKLISRLACSLVEKTGEILLSEGSRVRALYGGADRVTETFHCSFGLDSGYLPVFRDSGMKCTGFDPGGELRVVELEGHPFYMATMFQPERSALRGVAHPIILEYLRACRAG